MATALSERRMVLSLFLVFMMSLFCLLATSFPLLPHSSSFGKISCDFHTSSSSLALQLLDNHHINGHDCNSGHRFHAAIPVTLLMAAASSRDSSLDNKGAPNEEDKDDDEDLLSLESFQKAKQKIQKNLPKQNEQQEEFDGYGLRDAILGKFGACYDVDFNPVLSFGFRKLYLNIFPFQLGKRPFRHESEMDYLCHLQAVVEILQKYNQLDYVLYQISETKKRPIAGRSPIVAVPIRLDLTNEQVQSIMRY
jgi:Domain of unknown function (DUF3067)